MKYLSGILLPGNSSSSLVFQSVTPQNIYPKIYSDNSDSLHIDSGVGQGKNIIFDGTGVIFRATSNGQSFQSTKVLLYGYGQTDYIFKVGPTSSNYTFTVAPTTGNVLVGTTTDNGNTLQVNGTSYLSGNTQVGNAAQLGGEVAKLKVLADYEGGNMNGALIEANGATQTLILRHTGSTSSSLHIDAANASLFALNSAFTINANTNVTNYVQFKENNSTKFYITRAGNTYATSFVKTGGTSSEFLKADGSVDSNTYLTSYTESQTLDDVTTLGNTTTNAITVGGLVSSGAVDIGGNKIGRIANNQYMEMFGATGEYRFVNGAGGGWFFTWCQNSGTATPPAEKMRLSTNNNLLIGTTIDAGYKLDVNGTARFSGDTYLANDILVSNGSGTRYIKSPNGTIGFLASDVSNYNLKTSNGIVVVRSRLHITGDSNYYIGIDLKYGTTQTSPSGYGYELNFNPQVNHVATNAVIRGLDSSYGGNAATPPTPIYIFGGQNTTSGAYGDVILQSDFTTARGNVGIGTNAPTQLLHVEGNARITGALYDSNNSAGTSGQILSSTGTGTDWVSLAEITGVDGTGTANYLAKWSDADTITSSLIYDDGTNVGIGTSSPSYKFHLVDSNSTVGGSYASPFYISLSKTSSGGSPLATYFTQELFSLGGTDNFGNSLGKQIYTTISNTGNSTYRNLMSRVHTTGSGNANSIALYGTHFEGLGTSTIHNFYGAVLGNLGGVTNFSNVNSTLTNTYGLYIGSLTSGTQTNAPYAIYQSGTEKNYFNGNVLIGTTTNAGFKLDVNGSSRFKGTGTTSSTTSILAQNSSGINTFAVSDDGKMYIWQSGGTTYGAYHWIDGYRYRISPNPSTPGGFSGFSVADGGSGTLIDMYSGHRMLGINSKFIFSRPVAAPHNSGFGFETYSVTNFWLAIKDIYIDNNNSGISFSTKNAGSTVERVRILTTGEVGIGTTTPAHKVDVDGGVAADYFQLDTTATPTPAQGMIYWDADEETAAVQVNGLNYELGQGLYWVAKNQTGSQINKGTAVYASGTLGASGRLLISPMIADGSIPAKYFLGITAEDIADGDDGKVITQGKIRQIDTSGYGAAGNVLWVSATTAGALTQTQPTGSNLALAVAFVVDFAANGTLAARVSNLDENSIGVIPTLDQVTTAGNTTNNSITVGGLDVTNGAVTLVNRFYASHYTSLRLSSTSYSSDYKIGSTPYGLSLTYWNNDNRTYLRVGNGNTSVSDMLYLGVGGPLTVYNGNVQIGTTTDAGYKLDVNGTARVQGDLRVSNGVIIGAAGGESFTIGKITGGGGVNVNFNSSSSVNFYGGCVIDNISGLSFGSTVGANKILANTSGTFLFSKSGAGLASYEFDSQVSKVVVQNSLLIGTTTDAGYKLDVNGTTRHNGATTINNRYLYHQGDSAIQYYMTSNAWSGSNTIFFGDDSSSTIGSISYSHQFDSLSFNVNGSNALFIDSSRNVGIGTTSPTYKLDVAGDIRTNQYLYLGADTSLYRDGANILRTDDAFHANGNLHVGSSGYIYNRANTNSYIKFTSPDISMIGGSVGIGTLTPSHGLTVTQDPGNGRIARLGYLELTTQDANYTGSSIVVTGVNSYIKYVSTLGHKFVTRVQGGGNTLEALTINPDTGYVGINAAAPNTRLHIQGDTPILQIRETSGNAEAGISINHAVSGNHYNWFIGTLDGNARKLTIGATVTDGHSTNTAQAAASLFIVDQSTSSVGIGTTAPSTKLDVNGVITATGGNSTQWNTAYSWGDHSTQSYATQSYVTTAISNLVDSAPSTLDTLNELAAALGDDPNFATTVTNSIASKVPQTRTLTINGTAYDLSANRSWTIATTTPGGSDTQFQYNSSGSLAGASALTYNSANNRIGVNQASPGYDFDVNGQVRVQDKLRVGTVNSGNGVVHMSSSATINPNTTTIVWAQNVSVGMCAFIEYYILNNNSLTDQRAGTIMVTWNQSGTPTIAHTETTTPDIGSTTAVNFTSTLVGSDARINAVNSSANPYTIVMSYKYF